MLEKGQVIVFDDFIDKDYQEKIKKELLGAEDHLQQFPWFYVEDVTTAYDDDSQHRPGLSHSYVDLPLELTGDENDVLEPYSSGIVMSEYHQLFVPMLKRVGFKLEVSNVRVLQGRSFLQFPVNTDGTIDLPHIDIIGKAEFIVALYYVCNSDGDTVIYNETKESKTYTINKSVTPKQGRMVIFDGRLFHAAKQPINSNTRCIVNYNLGV